MAAHLRIKTDVSLKGTLINNLSKRKIRVLTSTAAMKSIALSSIILQENFFNKCSSKLFFEKTTCLEISKSFIIKVMYSPLKKLLLLDYCPFSCPKTCL